MSGNIFRVIYVIGFVVGSAIRSVYMVRNKRNRITKDRETPLGKSLMSLSSVGLVIMPFLYLLTSWLDFADYRLPMWISLTAGLAGAVVFAIALWLLWRSHADLGRNWLPMLQIREEHILVTQGVFRYTRHPMYAAHWLWAVSQALLLQNWIAGLSMIVTFIPIYVFRVPREEQMLLEQFGEDYRSYMERTGRMIPSFSRK